MKTIFTLAVLTLSVINLSLAQNVSIPDTTFKNLLLANTAININEDSEIQVSEAEAFNGIINAESLGITDLTGIETFINLTGLDCSRNSISKLDLNFNTSLTYVSCIYSDLDTLIIGNNSIINLIHCYGNNLTEIDLSQAPALETIRMGINSFKKIDLSHNPNLQTVDFRDCNLLSLDVRNGNNEIISFFYIPGNPELKCVSVDNVTFATENWTNIDPWVEFSNECCPYKITFTVSDGTNPISGASVTMVNIDEIIVTTNPSGQAVIDKIGKGSFIYKVEADGYKGTSGTLTVSDADVSVDIQLNAGETDTVYIPDENFRNAL
ncbi:MAG: hypothetical protein JW833_09150, partial [Prolixibacteraceae bacterium]|nr:hypothetical protein [Prolixibacteraceae bacterium]